MSFDFKYWTKVGKRLFYVILILVGLIVALKLSVFYIPFLIAFIFSLLLEKPIKYIMKKTKITRRVSAIIIFIISISVIIGSFSWIIITLFSESSNLLKGLNEYYDKAYIQMQDVISKINFDKIHLSNEILLVIQNSTNDILITVSNWIRDFLTNLLNFVTRLPYIAICSGITLISLYFICVDKIYILDLLEHHLPQDWVKKIGNHFRDLIKTLGGYLKSQIILVIISFIVSLIGLYALRFSGFNIQYPLLMALFIGFVDALPILGSGTVMIPWAIISSIDGDIKLGIAILVLLIIMSIIRQVVEPKLVSKNIGVHPIFTLIAMYTGFKLIGVFGLLIGPILLIIFKNIFSNLLDQGIFKSIFDKK